MWNLLYVLVILMMLSACQPKVAPEDSHTNNTEEKTSVQALLLVQPFPYDNRDKNKVTGPYEQRNNISIPSDLATQSKWIMFEGPVLENNIIAYRYYADSRHRFDIYAKTVPDLVMDTVGWQYHDIMDWGTDVLKVGNSLGIGSPAIYTPDSLYTLSNTISKTIEIIDSEDPDLAHIRTIFDGLVIMNDTFNLIQDWTLRKDDAFSEISLEINKPLPVNMKFATGIVKHLEAIEESKSERSTMAYNWGIQSFHKENMGMAVVLPNEYAPIKVDNNLSHLYIFQKAAEKVKYRFLAAWERDNSHVQSIHDFAKLVEQATY